jgi:hypothetical protein
MNEWTSTLPNEFSLWELESWWTSEFSKGDRKGQNSLDWIVSYTIEKLLERRCWKWACMTHLCRNPSFEFATKARAYKVAGQEGSSRVTPHAHGSLRECEGMSPHTPKGVFTLGVIVSVDS